MRKPKSRNRTFQSHGAGKGCADRTSDDAAYRKNFDRIKWSNKKWVTPPVEEDNEMRESARGYLGEVITNRDIPDTTKYKTPPTWDDELSSAGAFPLGYATWDGYYHAKDVERNRGK